MSELARRVRERRAALGLSQEELADRMGYRSKSSITKLEKGVNDRDFKVSEVDKLCHLLGLNRDQRDLYFFRHVS